MAVLVADNANLYAGIASMKNEVPHSGEHRRVLHASTVDITLHLDPGLFLVHLPQMIAHGTFVSGQRFWNQSLFKRHTVEYLIVTDDRIVEIQAHDHKVASSAPS